mgnify:CR=1 FL=1
MNGLLIYNKEDIEKNSWFIKKIIDEFFLNGIEIKLTNEENLDFNNLDSSFAIYRGRNYKVAKKLEETGLIVFNNDLVSKLANDKYETYKSPLMILTINILQSNIIT